MAAGVNSPVIQRCCSPIRAFDQRGQINVRPRRIRCRRIRLRPKQITAGETQDQAGDQ